MLAVDQFEEVFTACSDVGERTAFLDAITEAAAAPDGTTTIVIAMRADFYGRCAEHRGLASLLASHQILVGPMDADELRRAIELPAQRADLTVEEQLTESLVSDTVGQPGGLPLLSTALPRAVDPPPGSDPSPRRLPACRWGARGPSHGWRRKPSAGSMPTGRRQPSASCFAWRHRAKGRRWSAVARCSRSSTWTATPTRRARWRSSPTRASSPSRKGRPRSPTKRCSMNGRGFDLARGRRGGTRAPSSCHGVIAQVGRGWA